MSKKNKPSKNFINETPDVYNMDDIGYMTDEAIHDRSQRLENERNRLLSMNKDAHLWEVEVAYLRREQQLRQTRSELHAEYMKKFVPQAEVDVILAESNETTETSESN
jgi:hypothetical protein